jgi:hypothetical protein
MEIPMKKVILKLTAIGVLAAAASVMSIAPASAWEPGCQQLCGQQTSACHSGCGSSQSCHNSCAQQYNACIASC